MSRILITIFIFLSSLILAKLLFPTYTSAAALFYDDFEDGAIFDKWNLKSGNWNIETFLNSKWAYTQSEPLTDNEIQTANSQGLIDYEFSLDIYRVSGADINLFFRIQSDRFTGLPLHNMPVSYGLHLKDGRFALQKFTEQTGVELIVVSEPFPIDSLKKIKVKLLKNNIRVYVTGQSIPIINYTDTDNPHLNGGVALAAITGASDSYVRYDNVTISELVSEPTPIPTTGPFDLPIEYDGRPNSTPEKFKKGFWKVLNAVFDHVFAEGVFRPFTGDSYTDKDCQSAKVGISCYDSHNGTDFSKKNGKKIFSVADGTVLYTSDHKNDSCKPEKGGFGCVIIAEYPGGLFGLYAHLDRIYVEEGSSVSVESEIGRMGETGCPGCGTHLHFGVPKLDGVRTLKINDSMKRNDWKSLLGQLDDHKAPKFKPFCSYKAPNGQKFFFQDPSGWKGNDEDPWSKSKDKGGCGIISPYLWKFDVGTFP